MIELAGVSKRFDGVRVVDAIDLRIPSGRTVVLIGPSGCGKSTLLRLMLGLAWPDSGRVRFDGAGVGPATIRTVRRRVGYVIQDGGLFPHMTSRGNVSLMARQLSWPAERIDERISHLTSLTHFPAAALDRYPVELSGGQRQRVALMRALMLDPEVLLLDEPLGALDPMIRYELQRELKAIFDELSKTVVLVTHDLAEAAHFADDLVLLQAGRVAQRGSLREMIERPADDFVKRFVSAQRGLTFAGGAG